jgi:hypothetical protein
MPSKTSDIEKIVLDTKEQVDSIEKTVAMHHERIGIVEKATASMSLIPQAVSALNQKVESLDTSMKREVDGLREQHKAHKADTEEKMNEGFTKIGTKVDSVVHKVDGIVLRSATDTARQRGWWDVLQVTGQILLGLAVIGEFIKALLPH